MYQSGKLKAHWSFLWLLSDTFCLILALPLSGAIAKLWLQDFVDTDVFMPFVLLGQATLVTIIQARMITLGAYSWPAAAKLPAIDSNVARSLLLGIVLILFGKWAFNRGLEWWHSLWMLIYFFVSLALIAEMRSILKWLILDFFHIGPLCKIAFVGWSSRLKRVLEKLNQDGGKFEAIVGYFASKPFKKAQRKDIAPLLGHYLGTIDDIEKHCEKREFTHLLVDEAILSREQLSRIRDFTSRGLIGLEIIPSAFDMWLSTVEVRTVRGLPIMELRALPINRFYNRAIKRTIDIIGSLVGLTLSLPIIGILGYLINRESPGPIFYSQTRVGRHNKPFRLYKLRSMILDAEKENKPGWTKRHDPRRLRIGEFMRKWNLDELPQFWNVLRGDMSLVGPRPERPEFIAQFKKTVPYYNLVQCCRPGLTGWAAIHGLRGNTSIRTRLSYSLYYIENWSIFLDFQIMARTLASSKNAY